MSAATPGGGGAGGAGAGGAGEIEVLDSLSLTGGSTVYSRPFHYFPVWTWDDGANSVRSLELERQLFPDSFAPLARYDSLGAVESLDSLELARLGAGDDGATNMAVAEEDVNAMLTAALLEGDQEGQDSCFYFTCPSPSHMAAWAQHVPSGQWSPFGHHSPTPQRTSPTAAAAAAAAAVAAVAGGAVAGGAAPPLVAPVPLAPAPSARAPAPGAMLPLAPLERPSSRNSVLSEPFASTVLSSATSAVLVEDPSAPDFIVSSTGAVRIGDFAEPRAAPSGVGGGGAGRSGAQGLARSPTAEGGIGEVVAMEDEELEDPHAVIARELLAGSCLQAPSPPPLHTPPPPPPHPQQSQQQHQQQAMRPPPPPQQTLPAPRQQQQQSQHAPPPPPPQIGLGSGSAGALAPGMSASGSGSWRGQPARPVSQGSIFSEPYASTVLSSGASPMGGDRTAYAAAAAAAVAARASAMGLGDTGVVGIVGSGGAGTLIEETSEEAEFRPASASTHSLYALNDSEGGSSVQDRDDEDMPRLDLEQLLMLGGGARAPEEQHPQLSSEQARRLPRVRFEAPERQNCSICLEVFRQGMLLTGLSCGHVFHVDCLTQWVQRSAQCPNCRAVVEPCGSRPASPPSAAAMGSPGHRRTWSRSTRGL